MEVEDQSSRETKKGNLLEGGFPEKRFAGEKTAPRPTMVKKGRY